MKKKILVVDDVYPNRYLMEEALTDYQCLFAADGFQMWETLKIHTPDLILMDIGLPGDDGITLSRKLSQDARYSGIPVVFLTAHSTRKEIIEGMRAGGHDYILKPVDHVMLVRRIEDVLLKKSRNE